MIVGARKPGCNISKTDNHLEFCKRKVSRVLKKRSTNPKQKQTNKRAKSRIVSRNRF